MCLTFHLPISPLSSFKNLTCFEVHVIIPSCCHLSVHLLPFALIHWWPEPLAVSLSKCLPVFILAVFYVYVEAPIPKPSHLWWSVLWPASATHSHRHNLWTLASWLLAPALGLQLQVSHTVNTTFSSSNSSIYSGISILASSWHYLSSPFTLQFLPLSVTPSLSCLPSFRVKVHHWNVSLSSTHTSLGSPFLHLTHLANPQTKPNYLPAPNLHWNSWRNCLKKNIQPHLGLIQDCKSLMANPHSPAILLHSLEMFQSNHFKSFFPKLFPPSPPQHHNSLGKVEVIR